ncbi:MAG: response regulator transcription factor [Salibacteraceae bacterium]
MKEVKHILLAEDDESMGFLLKDSLENYGFKVTHVVNGKLAIDAFQVQLFDLCLLDVMMPVIDGFSVAQEIRKTDEHTPIIFLTAKALKEDRIKGFKIGADDYVTKPFSVEELSLRIKAIFKRGTIIQKESKEVAFGNCILDKENFSLNVNGKIQQLTQKEVHILMLFANNPNALLKREYILLQVWKDDGYFVGRSLDVFISKIRKYLKPDETLKISNVHGLGYKLEVAQ